MPGPATLVAAAARELARGACVAIALPAHAPSGLAAAIRRASGHEREWACLPLPSADFSYNPAEWLWHYTSGAAPAQCPARVTAGQLLEYSALPEGRIWELPELPEAEQAAWLRFLLDYQHALPTVEYTADRSLFVWVLSGSNTDKLPTISAPQLTVLRYDGQATGLDMLLYLSQNLPFSDMPSAASTMRSVEREVRIQTAAALYPHDPDYALAVAEGESLELADLERQAKTWQHQRGWTHTVAKTPALAEWATALAAWVDGQRFPHLLAPTTESLAARIRQALWLAQIKVILPYLEQHRWRILHLPAVRIHLERSLRERPFERQYDNGEAPITDIAELEFAHILARLPQPRHASLAPSYIYQQELHDKLVLLRECRNKLSHLQPLTLVRIEQLVRTLN